MYCLAAETDAQRQQEQGGDHGEEVVGAVHQPAPGRRLLVLGCVRGRVPDCLGDADGYELPVDEHGVPLEQKARPILCIPIGITLTALAISETVAPMLFDEARISASSRSFGTISLVLIMAIPMVTRQQADPSQKQTKIQ